MSIEELNGWKAREYDALKASVAELESVRDDLSRAYAVQGLALEEEQTRVAELERENKEITETAQGYIDDLAQTGAILEAITGALKGEEPSDFMRSFPDVEQAWWIYRLAYPKP